ncbi:hypothetical protein TNCV_1186351 [Trichonephila clavipes]|nr:hypothetical protein TNCV_1186351 [Trichonephila clavipes]
MSCFVGFLWQLPCAPSASLHSALQLGVACTVASTQLSVILKSLPKLRDDSLKKYKFLRYFHLSTPAFQVADSSTT